MTSGDSRSEQVVSAYKRHKLSRNALLRIRELLQQFERERAFDRRLAWFGIAIIAMVLVFAVISRLNAGQVVIF